MNKNISTSIFLIFSFIAFGQCPTDDIYLLTQSEVDAFATTYPNCTHLNNSLNIDGNNITNLNGLLQIQDVNGGIFISDTSIQDLSGLNNIQNLNSSLIITTNYSLTSFNGLQNLESIKGQFAVALNTEIENFEGLNSLNSIGIGSDLGILIASNDILSSFQGLENLAQIHGKFDVKRNELLENFNGLENLISIYGYISLRDNQSLETLQGLENLIYCEEYLSITENTSLTSISDLNNLDSSAIIGVIIQDNTQLPFCAILPVCDAIANPDTNVSISNNSSGCNSVPEVEAQCDLAITEADFFEDLSFFPNPVSSTLNIKISENISFEKAKVYSTLGELILETSEKQINLENLSAGIYFVEVVTDKGSVTKKIVKE